MGRIETSITQAMKDPEARAFAASQLETIRAGAAHADALVVWFGRAILLLASTFVLASNSVLQDLEVLGFKVGDSDFVLLVLPPIVALIYHRLLAQMICVVIFLDAYDRLLELLQPAYFKNDLELFGHPPSFAAEHFLSAHTKGWRRKLFLAAAAPHEFVFVWGTPVFLLYSYVVCFVRYAAGHLDVWLSLIVTSIALARALVYWVACKDL